MGPSGVSLGFIIQARMGSTRLPGKVLRPIAGRPLLAHVVGRLRLSRHRPQMVIATSTEAADQAIVDWCQIQTPPVLCFRGDEADVLDRYLSCARQFGFDQIVRLTADNPFTDIEELDRLIDMHLAGRYAYSHSFGMMPLGVGAEVMSLAALDASHRLGHEPHHREHVNEYIQENPDRFPTAVLDVPESKRAADLRLTVDTPEDWRRACLLAEAASGRWLGTEEAIRLCLDFA